MDNLTENKKAYKYCQTKMKKLIKRIYEIGDDSGADDIRDDLDSYWDQLTQEQKGFIAKQAEKEHQKHALDPQILVYKGVLKVVQTKFLYVSGN